MLRRHPSSRGAARELGSPLALGLIAALVALVGVSVLAFVHTRRIARNHLAVVYSGQILTELDELLSALKDAETGQRGFLLTGNTEYLEPYHSSAARIRDGLEHLRERFVLLPDQAPFLELVAEKAQAKLAELSATLALEQAGDHPAALEMVRSNLGLNTMEALRSLLARMRAAEQMRIDVREAASLRSQRTALASIVVAGLAGGMLVLVAFGFLRRASLRLGESRLALEAEHERLRVTLASIGDAVIVTGPRGEVQFLNAVARALTAWGDEALGRPLREVFHIVREGTDEPAPDPVERVLREGLIVGLANHTTLLAKDGAQVPIDDSAAPIRTRAGEIGGVVLVFRDVRERRARELAAQETARLHALRADLGAALASAGPRSEVLDQVARALVRRLPARAARVWVAREDADELELRAAAGASLPALEREPLGAPGAALAAGDAPTWSSALSVPLGLGAPEQRSAGASCVAWPLRSEGRALGLLGVALDEAASDEQRRALAGAAEALALYLDRKASEARAREAHERLDVATDAAGMGTWRADLRGGHVLRDARLNEMLGNPARPSRVPLDELFAHVAREDRARVRRAFERALSEGTPYQVEYRVTQPDGSRAWLRESARPVPAEGGGPGFVAGSMVDVTKERESDRKVYDLVRELRESDRHKDEFLATLAHELRNPLAPLRNMLELMRRGGDDPSLVERARESMLRQVDVMVRLIDDLLELNRIRQGKIELRRERVALHAIVDDVLESVRPLAEESGLALEVDLPAEPVELEVDRVRLAQVLNNLLSNSCKYTEPGGHVRLAARREGERLQVSVRDDGAGIPPEMLPRIFEMFSQVPGTRHRSGGGLGIGLALVRRLVELHGGTVEARSAGAGRGSEFTLDLPLHGASEVATPPRPAPRAQASAHPRRILVVDDNEDSANSLALLLSITGHETRVAHDGPEALELAAGFHPSVVLLDIGLPTIDGHEVCRRLRALPESGTTLIVAVTGWGQEQDLVRSRAAGFDAHMVKPIDFDRLAALIEGGATPSAEGG